MRYSTLLIGLLAVLTAATAVSLFRQASKNHFSAGIVETFARWKLAHGKLYGTPSENDFRLSVFANEIAFVEKNNEQYSASAIARGEKLSGPMFEMNMFGDLTTEEFEAKYTGDVAPSEEYFETIQAPPTNTADFAGESQLGQTPFIPRVRNQGACGSCWAFSAIVEYEKLAYKQYNQYIDLSHQELVDCVTACNGCNGGASDQAYNYVYNRGGVSKASDYPYRAAVTTCQNNKIPMVSIAGTGYSYFQLFTISKAVEANRRGVLSTISVFASGAFRYFSSTDDIFNGRDHIDCDSRTGHAIVMMDFQGDVGRVLNSWGAGWGVGGYKRIRACNNNAGQFFGTGGRFVYPYSF